MKKQLKRIFSASLAVSLIMNVMSINTLADSTAPEEPSNPYTYYYNSYDINVSPHFIGNGEWTMIFRLDNEYWEPDFNIAERLNAKGAAAYCCDITTGLNRGENYPYRRMNLEDSTYYGDEAAKYIRGIFSNGYWPGNDWDLKKAESKANKWLESKYPDSDYKICSMSNAEALTATQAAIWHFANDESADALMYDYTGDASYMASSCSRTTVDPITVDYREGSRETTENNINLFIKYLINQKGQLPEKVLFTEKQFISDELFFTTEDEAAVNCNGTLFFKLDGTIGAKDKLQLCLEIGDRDVITYPLTGNGALKPDDNGYYRIEIKDLTEDEAADGVNISIRGYQMVDGVYFYEAKPTSNSSAQKASQNLVGYYKGKNEVYAEANVGIDFGTTSVSMYKYDADTEVESDYTNGISIVDDNDIKYYKPLDGAIFSLYAKIDDEYLEIRNDLTTDENGYIQVNGLIEGYEYYFVESDAPDGYELNDNWYKAAADPSMAEPVYIENHTVEETTTQEETTTAPEESSSQETTTAPEESSSQETTTAPEESSSQETTTAPEESSSQETTTTPETTTRVDDDDDDNDPETTPRTTAPTTTVPETFAPETTTVAPTSPTVIYRGVEIPQEILAAYPDKTLDELYDMGVLGAYFENVPTGLLPATNDMSVIWTAMSILSAIGLAGVSVIGKKREDDEE